MNNPAQYRVTPSRPGTRRPVTLEAIRWTIHLGANTARRMSIATGIPIKLASNRIAYAVRAGVVVKIGDMPGRTRRVAIYGTPDPGEFP